MCLLYIICFAICLTCSAFQSEQHQKEAEKPGTPIGLTNYLVEDKAREGGWTIRSGFPKKVQGNCVSCGVFALMSAFLPCRNLVSMESLGNLDDAALLELRNLLFFHCIIFF